MRNHPFFVEENPCVAVLSQRLTGQPEADMDSVSAHSNKRDEKSSLFC